MKIEAGRYYRTRDGRKVGPMNVPPRLKIWASVVEADANHNGEIQGWRKDGKFCPGRTTDEDLIAEWTDAPDLTAITTPFGLLDEATREALKSHGGPYERWNGACWHEKPIPGWDCAMAYRVKPQPPKPREWWVSGGNCIWDTYTEAYNACDRGEKPVHVREVTD